VIASACATTPKPVNDVPGVDRRITFGGGDGSSCAERIVIRGAAGSREGVRAEYAWLRARYPGHRARTQSLIECEGHPSDMLDITTADGRDLAIYFDVSDFFGAEVDF
jgi:hypothetical protein